MTTYRNTAHRPLHLRLRAVAALAARGDWQAFETHLLPLLEPDAAGVHAASVLLWRLLDGAVGRLWDRGWQPADLLREVERSAPSARDVLPSVLAHEAARYRTRPGADPEWLEQLHAAQAYQWWDRDPLLVSALARRVGCPTRQVVRAAVLLLSLCSRLPPLPLLRPAPRLGWAQPTRAAVPSDAKLLARVRGLLDKAESTEFAAEAEALTGKAQELMTRYSLDAAMLAVGCDETGDQPAAARRLGIEDPYARQKAALLSAVARPNGCQVVYSSGYGFCTVFGLPHDLASVEMLHASLLLQATRAVLAAGTQRDGSARAVTRSFRTSFLAAFAMRIGQRLEEATRSATTEARADYGAALLPVLVRREAAVDELFRRVVPHTRTMRTGSGTSGDGWRAGIVAANSADLATEARLGQRARSIGSGSAP